MNKEETKKAIEVMQAYVDGEEIEYYEPDESEWIGIEPPSWIWSACDYRIKSEPLVLWVNVYNDGAHSGYNTKEKAERRFQGSPTLNGRTIKMIEVI